MSAPYGQLPRWVEFGLMPLVNVVVAFLVSGLVVLFIGENPLTAVKYLVTGALGSGEGLGVALVCLLLDHITPWYITAPLAALAAFVYGAAWAFIPALLQARRGSHIV